MSSQIEFPVLYKLADQFEQNDDRILSVWISSPRVESMFRRFGILPGWFRENYGQNILGHFLSVMRGHRPSGDCPYMVKMVRFLKDKNATITDIFDLCASLRNTVRGEALELVSTMKEESFVCSSAISEVAEIFDANLRGIFTMYSRNLTDRERQLEEYMRIIDQNVIISKTDLNGIIIHVSEAFCRASGYTRERLIGESHNIVRHPDTDPEVFRDLWDTIEAGKTWYGRLKNRDFHGNSYWVDGSISPLEDRDGNVYGYMAIRHDVTDSIMRFTDPLTGVANRQKFEEVLEEWMSEDSQVGAFSLILLDIDHFKSVNDDYGHDIGDHVLMGVSSLVEAKMRKSDLFARWGGEEFAILFQGPGDLAALMAERLRKVIEQYDFLEQRTITCSFGVSGYLPGQSREELFQRADKNLYEAKKTGRNRVVKDDPLA